jgi:hypothetical protein
MGECTYLLLGILSTSSEFGFIFYRLGGRLIVTRFPTCLFDCRPQLRLIPDVLAQRCTCQVIPHAPCGSKVRQRLWQPTKGKCADQRPHSLISQVHACLKLCHFLKLNVLDVACACSILVDWLRAASDNGVACSCCCQCRCLRMLLLRGGLRMLPLRLVLCSALFAHGVVVVHAAARVVFVSTTPWSCAPRVSLAKGLFRPRPR